MAYNQYQVCDTILRISLHGQNIYIHSKYFVHSTIGKMFFHSDYQFNHQLYFLAILPCPTFDISSSSCLYFFSSYNSTSFTYAFCGCSSFNVYTYCIWSSSHFVWNIAKGYHHHHHHHHHRRFWC
uniref:BTB domain-containing protein n=1 Tax=Heterorhabditis bacteriophora TaxID=37862 RepID=A0A1I7WRX8_HETBA